MPQQDRGWRVVNVSFLEWEALPADPSLRAAALLQLLSNELGAPASEWRAITPPSRAPGSLLADADAQVAQQQQQATATTVAALLRSSGARLSLGGQQAQASSWGALGMSALPGGVLGVWGGADGSGFGSSSGQLQQLVPALGVWGSGSFAAPMSEAAAEPSLLQQLAQMQQQQQVAAAAWDAFVVAADGTSPDASDAAAAARSCQQADSPWPSGGSGAGGSPDSSGGGGASNSAGSGTKPAAPFIWGDLTTASIWAA
jgi:hypothetical protein